MPRIRTIKPEFWSDDSITECSLSARLLFIGMWNFADDAGNLDRSAKQIKARVFPNDKVDCEALIQDLLAHGLLIEYSVSDRKYLHIPGFAEHQVINRPSKPTVPSYSDSLKTQGTLSEPSVSTHSGRKGREGKGDAGALRASRRAPPDFVPDAEYALAQIPDLDVPREAQKFKDYEFKTPRSDWPAVWRTWIAKAREDGRYAKLHGGIKWQ